MISRAVRDAWKINPPCEKTGDCRTECPYYVECNGDNDDDGEEPECDDM